MDPDNIIPLVVAIFWILAAILGKGAKKKRESSEPKKEGLLSKIQSAVENIAEEMQAGASTQKDFNFNFLEDDIAQDEEIAVMKRKIPPLPVLENREIDMPIRKVMPHSVKESVSEPKYSSGKLKEAIIWSEIMAPPLALRD